MRGCYIVGDKGEVVEEPDLGVDYLEKEIKKAKKRQYKSLKAGSKELANFHKGKRTAYQDILDRIR